MTRVRQLSNLHGCETIFMNGGSSEFLFLSLYHTDIDGEPTSPIDLSTINEIEWLLAPRSVIREKSVAKVHAKYTTGEVVIISDGSDGQPNRVQVTIAPYSTQNLVGAFRHQVIVTDGGGAQFVLGMGDIIINRRIQTT